MFTTRSNFYADFRYFVWYFDPTLYSQFGYRIIHKRLAKIVAIIGFEIVDMFCIKHTQVEVPDGKSICPDRPRRKVPMSRPSQTESAYVQTFVRSPDLRAFMSRLSCVHQTFVRSCPDFRAFTRLSCVHVQTFVRSPDFRAFMSRLSCVHQTFVRSPDFRAFMSRLSCVHQTFVRSCPDFRAFTKISCVHVQNFRAFTKLSCVRQTFVRSSDIRASTRLSCVQVQTLMRSSDFCAIMSRLLWLKCGAYPPKKSTIGLKFTILCPKQCSVIEKVKPNRARILFQK